MCKFSGKGPSSSHKTMIKQQINGQKRRKMKEKDLSCFGLVFTACSVLGAWKILSFFFHFLSVLTVYLLFKCRFVA